MFELHDYQCTNVAETRDAFHHRRVLFVLPTGGGKTIAFAHIHAHGWRWFLLLQHAGTDRARLREIQIARGYKSGWVRYAAAEAEEKLRRRCAA